MTVTIAIPTESLLGEGPAWHPVEQALYWVDILGRRLHRHDGEHRTWELPIKASAPVFRPLGLSLTTEDGIADFDLQTGTLTPRIDLEPDRPGNRANEARVDPRGRLWVGTMDDAEEQTSGALYRVSGGSVSRQVDGVRISNTLCWSPDERTLYFADSAEQTIYAHAFSPDDGEVGERRVFARTKGEGCGPDGSALDVEGYLWNCQWDGSRIVRYAPDGSIDRVLALPARRPTCCCFGGPDLDVLYITTARVGLTDPRPEEGAVLALDPGVRGRPEPLWLG